MSIEVTQVNTVLYPSWWAGASTVKIRTADSGVVYEGTIEGVELLPQGVSIPQGVSTTIKLFPWSNIGLVERTG